MRQRKKNVHAAQHTIAKDSLQPKIHINVPQLCYKNVIPDTEQNDVTSPGKRTIGKKNAIRQRDNEFYRAKTVENSRLITLSLKLCNKLAHKQTVLLAPGMFL